MVLRVHILHWKGKENLQEVISIYEHLAPPSEIRGEQVTKLS